MMENVGKIRIGVDVDSNSADKSLDGLYKKIRDLNSSINKLLSGRITLKVGVDKQSLTSTTSEINSYIQGLSNTTVKLKLALDDGVKEQFKNSINSTINDAFASSNSSSDSFTKTVTGFKDVVQSEQVIRQSVEAIVDLQNVLDSIQFNKNATVFFKRLTSCLSMTQLWGMYGSVMRSTASTIEGFFNTINSINVDNSKAEQIRDTFKNLKGTYNVGETANLSSLANNISGVQSTISGLNTEELLAKSKDIRTFINNTSSIQNIPDTAALGTLASNLIAFNNKISSISATSDEQKKVISYIVSVVNKLASINIDTSTFNLDTLGNQLVTFVNSLNTINISDTATKTISTFSSVLNKIAKMSEVLSGITFNSANINTFITGITDLVQKLESVNISDKAEKIIKLADAIKTLNNASKDKSGSNLSKSSSLIDKLGKASNVTWGIIKKLGTAFSNLGRKTKEVGTSANKVAQTIKKSYTELLSKIRLITGAIRTFINTFKNLSSAYNTQVSAETRFTVAATNSANATKEQINNIKDLTAEYQQLGILGDEVQLTGLQELSTYVESTESIKKLLPIMNDMTAQQFGFEATTENAFTIATALGKVLNGNTDTLKRYGYAFNDAEKQILKYGTEEQKVAVLTQVVESAVGGMNEAMANTPTGTIKQLKNNFGDLKESLGELLTYAVLPLVKYINILILRIKSGVQSLTQFIKTAFGIKTVAKDVNTITDGVSSVNNKNIDKTSDSLDDLGDSASKTKKKVNNLLGSFDELNILSDSSSDSTDSLADALNSIDSDSLDLGYGVSETIEVPDINDFKNKIKQLLASIDYSALGKEWGEGFNKIIDKWNPVTSAEKLANALNNIISTVNNFLTTADFNKLGKKIGTWVNKFVQKFDSKALGNIISNGINGAIAFANGALTETNFKALGESIGNFIMGIFGNLDYEGLGDALINALDAAVDTAAGIISKIDFKAIGEGLAKATNRITKRTDTFKKLGKALSDAIIGVFDLAITYLDETDFEQVGKAIGAFLAGLDWGTILKKAGEAIWKGLKAALSITIGAFKENPIAGTLIGVVEALLLFKGASKVIGIIKNLGSTLGIFGKTVSTDIVEGNTANGISGLATSVLKLAAAHPAVAAIAGIGTAVAGIAISIASAYADYVKKESGWKQYLLNVTALDEASKAFIESTKTSNEKIKDISKAIKESADTANTDAAKFETLYNNLSTCVDKYGNIKKGSEDYANYLIGELNNAYGTNLKNIDGQIQGYTDLCNSIDKYIAKMKAQAIVTANEGNYADAITEYKKANKDLVEAQKGYEDNLSDLETLGQKVTAAYNTMFDDHLDLGNVNTVGGLDKLKKAMHELSLVMNKDQALGFTGEDYKTIFKKTRSYSKEGIKAVENYYEDIRKIASKYDKSIGFGSSVETDVTELAYALHNNTYEFLNAKNTAQDTIDTTKQQIDGYELLTKTLNSTTASVQDINAAMSVYVNDIPVSKGKSSLDTIIDKYKEWETEYNKAVELVKKGDLEESVLSEWKSTGQALERQMALAKANIAEGVATWTVDATKALFNSDNFASEGEYLAWYAKLFGEEHIPDAIASLTKVTGMAPDDIIKQYLKTYPEGTSENNVKQIVSKLYPDATKEEIASKVKTYMNYGRAQALKRYFDEHPNMSESDKKAFLKSIMPDGTSDDTVNKLYKVITDTVDSAVFKAEKHFDGGMFSTKGALGDVLSPTAKNAMKNVKSGNKFVNIGNSMAAGVEEGLKSGIPNIQKASSSIIDESDKAMRKEGDIHSPSKLTKLTGIALSEGVAVGIKEGLNKILDAVKYVCNKTVDAYKITGMNANILKTYAYSYVSNFFNGIALKGSEIVNIKNITDKVVSSFKLTLWNSGMLTKYGNAYVADYIKGVVLTDTNKKKVSDIQNTVIILLKPSVNTLNSAKTYGSSIIQSMISGMTVSSANKTTISNAGTTVYNSMISSMNNLSGSLSTSSNNFIHNLTNPITNGLSALLSSMDSFYIKFRNKWQGVANLLSNKFIAGSMGVTKVPNLNDNYYPFGNNIVKLAQGAVIKPNNEFMAILGDQKRGVNIETPLATMKQAFMEALNDGGYNGGNITIPVYIGNEKIDTLIINSNNRRNMRNNGRG